VQAVQCKLNRRPQHDLGRLLVFMGYDKRLFFYYLMQACRPLPKTLQKYARISPVSVNRLTFLCANLSTVYLDPGRFNSCVILRIPV
jgi:hypothetical protein